MEEYYNILAGGMVVVFLILVGSAYCLSKKEKHIECQNTELEKTIEENRILLEFLKARASRLTSPPVFVQRLELYVGTLHKEIKGYAQMQKLPFDQAVIKFFEEGNFYEEKQTIKSA